MAIEALDENKTTSKMHENPRVGQSKESVTDLDERRTLNPLTCGDGDLLQRPR